MSKIDDAKAQHLLADVARRTGIPVPEGATGDVTVQCPMPYPGTEGEVAPKNAKRTMVLHLDSNRWYCFTCAARELPAGGDVVQWVQNLEGVDALAAVAKLNGGGPITNHWPANPSGRKVAPAASWERPDLERTSRERVLSVLAAAWGYYSGPGGHKKGVEYLQGRTVDVGVLEAHTGRVEVGHTPKDSRKFLARMHEAGITDNELVDAGLVYRSRRGVSPVYSDRVIIPCRRRGQVVGFFGRDVTGTRPKDKKYVNLTTTLVYGKSVNLYQPLPAPSDEHGQVVVVEGTLDAMSIAIAAIKQEVPPMFCPVTQSGKVLSDAQLDYVLGIAKKSPVIAFDGDSAGRLANLTIATAIMAKGREYVVTTLPPKKDPATGEPVGWHDPASYLAEYGPEALDAFTRYECLKAQGDAVRPRYGPAFVVSQTWRTELAKALDASKDGDLEWAEVLAKAEVEGLRMRGKLPETAHIRYDTQVAKTLARHAAFEAVRHVVYTLEDESPQARATVAAKRANKWLSRFPKANPAKVMPVLSAELKRVAGEDPEMAALLPEAVPLLAQHPAKADQLAEMGHWEPPFIELPEAIGM